MNEVRIGVDTGVATDKEAKEPTPAELAREVTDMGKQIIQIAGNSLRVDAVLQSVAEQIETPETKSEAVIRSIHSGFTQVLEDLTKDTL